MHLLWLIAVHPDSPAAVLDSLAKQSAHPYAERIAENPSTCPSTLTFLSTHHNAECTHLSKEFLDRLLEDENPFVAERARKTKKRIWPAQPTQLRANKIRQNDSISCA